MVPGPLAQAPGPQTATHTALQVAGSAKAGFFKCLCVFGWRCKVHSGFRVQPVIKSKD